MSLFEASYDADTTVFDVLGVEADNPEKLEVELLALIAAAARPPLLVDVELGGAGAGPLWEAFVVMSAPVVSGKTVAKANVRLAAAVAGNPTEARLKAVTKLNAIAPTNVVKVVVAGAGVGPTYMALAVAEA